MPRWEVRVTGGELDAEARTALESAGCEAIAEEPGEEGFTVSLEAADSAAARRRVEQTLAQVGDGGYSAGPATKSD